MKKILSIIGVIYSATLLLSSCGPEPVNPNNEVVDTIPLSIDNYLPATSGSWWLYNSTLGDQYKRTSTGIDTMKDGLNMRLFFYTNMSTMDDNPEYFRRFDDVKYFTLFTFDSSETDPNYFRLVVMMDDPYVGMTWHNTGSMIEDIYGEIEMEANCKIESIDDVITVGDTTFTNAIKMNAGLRAKASFTTWKDCGYINYWFVKTVGIVKQEYNIDIEVGSISLFKKIHTDDLIDYHIEE